MSIQSEVERISSAKNNIINSIESKGVDVPSGTSISDLYLYIDQIKIPNSYFSEVFKINSKNWILNSSSVGNYDRYKNENTINTETSSDLTIVSVALVNYDVDNNSFNIDEANSFYSWKYIEVSENKIILYSDKLVSNNFGIIITFAEN